MNVKTLKIELEKLDIPKESYCLFGGLPNECYCIAATGDGWEIYYSERGSKTGIKSFCNESTACGYFLQLMMQQAFKKINDTLEE